MAEFLRFYQQVYGKDANFKDNKTCLLPLVAKKGSSFFQNSWQQRVAVIEGDRTLCQCVFIRHQNCAKILNMAFFEALEHCEKAVEMLISYGEKLARQKGCESLLAGMDGHLNYSLGFSMDGLTVPTFSGSYHPAYYHGYFQDFHGHLLKSFRSDIRQTRERLYADYKRYGEKLAEFSVEPARINKRNMRRYTDLSNQIFASHLAYFKREYQEDYELFAGMKLLLKPDNLLIIRHHNRDIGYVFWYPDFNRFVKAGRGFDYVAYLHYLVKRNPDAVKLMEMGLIPEYQNSGIVMLAFYKAVEAVGRYFPTVTTIYSSWIWAKNMGSLNFTKRYAKDEYLEYMVYEKKL